MFGQLAGQQASAATTYAQMQNQAPKEIGALDRLNGIRMQLFEIDGMLTAHGFRLEGSPPNVKEEPGLSGPGLRAILADCEGTIRNIRAKMQALNEIF